MFYTAVLTQSDHNSIFKCFCSYKPQQFSKIRSDHFLLSTENLCDYERRVEKEKSTTKQRQTPELE